MKHMVEPLGALLLLSTVAIGMRYSPQESEQVKSLLSMKETSSGPFAGQRSVACLTITSDGKVKYFHRWNPGTVGTDAKTGKKSLVERTVSVESQLSRPDLFALPYFLESDVVKSLPDSVEVPAVHIDYWESTTIHIIGKDGKPKRISISDYSTAGLEGKGKLPGALIVLMDKIQEIKKQASLRGRATNLVSKCPEDPD